MEDLLVRRNHSGEHAAELHFITDDKVVGAEAHAGLHHTRVLVRVVIIAIAVVLALFGALLIGIFSGLIPFAC